MATNCSVLPPTIIVLTPAVGVVPRNPPVKVDVVTVNVRVFEIAPTAAVITHVPVAEDVTSPAVTLHGPVVVHVAVAVRSFVEASLYVPVAAS